MNHHLSPRSGQPPLPHNHARYDDAGDMTGDVAHAYFYDAEGRIAQVDGTLGNCSTATACYVYDGDGLRVEKSTGMLYWRSITGDVVAESDSRGNTTNEYVFFAGRRIARISSGTVNYFYSDALGTVHTITDATGHPCYDASFTPYGQEVLNPNISQTCSSNYKFTGDEYDSETGLYYALARYYNPRLDRFMSPDPLAGAVVSAQSLNRYAYVANNPLNAVDTLGLAPGGCLVAQERGMSRSTGEAVCDYGPTSPDCMIDGGEGLCSTGGGDGISAGTNGGFGDSTVECPNDVCSAFGTNSNGDYYFVQFMAFQGDVSGFFYGPDLVNGINVFNGQIYSDANYSLLMQMTYSQAIEAQRKALAHRIETASHGAIHYDQALADLKTEGGHLQGGNWNFVLENGLGPNSSLCDSADRCNGVHFENGFVHLDTSNPFAGDVWSFLVHSGVDVLGGNILWNVIPR